MIDTVEIQDLRGIREGQLTGLTPLTVLVGPSGSGKSTILDGLLIGGGREPLDGVDLAVHRSPGNMRSPARWLFWKGGHEGPVRVRATIHGRFQEANGVELIWRSGPERNPELVEGPGAIPYGEIEARALSSAGDLGTALAVRQLGKRTFFLERTVGHIFGSTARSGWPQVHLMASSGLGAPLDKVLTRSLERGRFKGALGYLRNLVPAIQDLRVVTDEDRASVHVVFDDRSVPLDLAGDGIRALVRTTLELTTAEKDDLVLLEEPDAHQHPAAVWQTARAIVGAIERGIQVVVSTHSLELIDGLIDALGDSRVKQLSVHRTKLTEAGELRVSRHGGEQAVHARSAMELDLR
jgi:hypothetical protein